MHEQAWRERIDRALVQVVKQIVSRFDPERVIVFGSVARGDVHEDSDIDLMIVKETDRPFLKRIDDVLELLHVDVAVEPLVYTPEELERLKREGRDFIEAILREGRVVYEREAGSEPAPGRPLARQR